jgi:hypothetical protein
MQNNKLFTFITLTLILVISTVLTFLPPTNADEASTSNNRAIQNNTMNIMSNVMGISLEEYQTTLEECIQTLYMDTVPQKTIHCSLKSTESNLDVLYSFTNDKLRMMHIINSEGTPLRTTPPTLCVNQGNVIQKEELVVVAQNFLKNYESYNNNTFYSQLGSMLNNILVDENSTQISENIKLLVDSSTNETIFKWTYTFNGIDAPLNVLLYVIKMVFWTTLLTIGTSMQLAVQT